MRFFLRRGALWPAVVALPAVWVSYEYLTAVTSPHSTFGNLASSQMDCLPVPQVASGLGIWGVTFCLLLLPAAVAALASGTGSLSQRRLLAGSAGLFFVDHAKTLAADGAEVIVMPEKLGVVADPETREIDTLFQDAAGRNETSIVVGVFCIDL